GPEQGGAANVDVFDGVLQGAAGFGDGLFELVEIHHYQVDEAEILLLHLLQVAGQVPAGQDAGVHLGVQGLEPAIQHLRETGEVRDLGHRDPSFPQYLGGAPGGQNLNLATGQELAEFDDAAFIGDADQGPGNGSHNFPLSSYQEFLQF